MKLISFILIILTLAGIFTACNDLLIEKPEPNTVLNNFDVFGRDFQEKYGLFKQKGLDWPARLAQYRPQLEAEPTDAKLYEVLTTLIDELDDSHVWLGVPNRKFPSYGGGIYGRLERQEYNDFDFSLVLDKYLSVIDSVQGRIYYGKLSGNIAYIYLPEIYDVPKFFEQYMPGVMADLTDSKGLVIDIRDNNGGEDESSRTLAGFFSETTQPYMTSSYKMGPGSDDFEPVRTWMLEPASGDKYLKPIILLTNRFSVSAAETFSLAMKTLPHVIQVGDTTTGAFSDAVSRQLPNMWEYSLSVGDYRDADGISYESIGLAPDVHIVNSIQDLIDRTDRMLEAAMAELN